MKTLFKIGFIVLTVIFSGNLMAQEDAISDSNLLGFYDSELFHWSYNMMGGLALNFQNQSSSTTFGISKSMRDALRTFPDSGQEYNSYFRKNVSGNILMYSGLLAILGAVFIPIYTDINNDDLWERNFRIYMGVTLGGAVSTLIGSFIFSSGQENIFNAVNMYNRNRIRSFR